jgi:hypothetical protein
MKKLILLLAVIGLMSCKKEEACISDSGEVTFWLNQASSAKYGTADLSYYINDEYKTKAPANYYLIKAPSCGEYYENIVHLPANCGDTYKVENLKTSETLFSGKIQMGENNCLILELK